MIEFTIPLEQIPRGTAQQKRTNRRTGAFFQPDDYRKARNTYIVLCKRYAPKEPFTGCVDVHVIFAYNTSEKKKRGRYKKTRPDSDNIVKLYLDCLADCGFYFDDAQVARLLVEKKYSEVDRAYIATTIRQIEEG